MLAADQEELCRRFAVTGGDKFTGTPWRPGTGGAPLIEGSLATVECTLEAVLDGGDHAIALARVDALTAHRDTGPLLYFRRASGRLPSPAPDSEAGSGAGSAAPDAGSGAGSAVPDALAARAFSSSSMSASMASARSRSEA